MKYDEYSFRPRCLLQEPKSWVVLFVLVAASMYLLTHKPPTYTKQ